MCAERAAHSVLCWREQERVSGHGGWGCVREPGYGKSVREPGHGKGLPRARDVTPGPVLVKPSWAVTSSRAQVGL